MLKAPSTVTANLIRARELIADEKNWCQAEYNDGDRYCAVGAIREVTGVSDDFWIVRERLSDAAWELFRLSPISVNDDRSHAAVMRMFNRAIELSIMEGE